MSRRTWAVVVALIVGGVVLQIPAHSDKDMRESEPLEAAIDVEPGTKRVDLEVTGMT